MDIVNCEEKWKPIDGWPLYKISSHGRVLSKKRGSWRLKSISTSKSGYKRTILYNYEIKKDFSIHVLVATHFLRSPNRSGLQVAHLDGSKDNNFFKNLKWCSPKENSGHKYIHKTMLFGDNSPTAKLSSEKVAKIKEMLSSKIFFQYEIAKIFNINKRTISAINRGITWKHLT